MKTKTLFGVMAVSLGTLALPLRAGSWAVSLSFGIPWPAAVAMPAPVPHVPAVVPYPYPPPVLVARPVPWYVPPTCLAPPPCRPYRPVVMPYPAYVRHGQAYHHGHGHR